MAEVPESFDIIVIGGGPGGYQAALRARRHGLRVAVVEATGVGGTCLHRGCIPTKAMLETATRFRQARRENRRLGVEARDVTLNLAAALRHRDLAVSRLHRGLEALLQQREITVVQGRGRLAGPGMVEVETPGGRLTLAAGHVIVATGARPRQLRELEPDGERILDSDELLGLEELPASMLIVGGGAVGMEFASLLVDLGVRVTLVEVLAQVLPGEDPAVVAVVRRALERRGLRVQTGTEVVAAGIRRDGDALRVPLQPAGAPAGSTPESGESVRVEAVLVAVGREGCCSGLGLAALGVPDEGPYLQVDEHGRLGDRLFAVGDVTGGFLLAHVAAAEGRAVADGIGTGRWQPVPYERVPRSVYTWPELLGIGLTEQQALADGLEVEAAAHRFTANGRAVIEGEADGVIKLVVESGSRRLLGLHLAGPRVTELAPGPGAAFAGARGAGDARVLERLEAGFAAHPSLAESLEEAAAAALGRPIHLA